MELYIVNFTYRDLKSSEIENDMWILGCSNHDELIRVLELNEKGFNNSGYKIIGGWNYRKISETDNGHEVIVNKKAR